MQISPPRVTTEVHDWLTAMSKDTGLSVALIAGELLNRARIEGWKVEPLRVTAPPPQYRIMPGRYAAVVPDLADLKGPAEGKVELPITLFWSREDRAFEVSDDAQCLEMYENVLLNAGSPDEISPYLNPERLVHVWPDVYSKPVRRAWEDAHPVLREAAAKVAA